MVELRNLAYIDNLDVDLIDILRHTLYQHMRAIFLGVTLYYYGLHGPGNPH